MIAMCQLYYTSSFNSQFFSYFPSFTRVKITIFTNRVSYLQLLSFIRSANNYLHPKITKTLLLKNEVYFNQRITLIIDYHYYALLRTKNLVCSRYSTTSFVC